ncbi:hypothetical protein RJT34_26130 [Clitoria ternatea]|uniref:Uncharacterized protein n=1 Tax=Clitoria ternatea TaxID=43366 RepID=A0AAN9F8H6_CLITE
MASQTIFDSESDEDSWVIQINQLVDETNLTVLNQIPVCVYQVPKSLSSVKPQAFSPQLIGIGPYNHFRNDLYPMERLKIFGAKRILDHFNKHNLKQLVEQLHNSGPYIRACYHKYLDLKDDTLLYTMAIDALFLLDFFHSYVDVKKVSGPLMGTSGQEEEVMINGVKVKLTKDAIIRDLFMVENQIPTYFMLRIFSIESSKAVDSVQEYLGSMLLSFCEKHSPLMLNHTSTTPTNSEVVTKHYHVLDLMYHLLVSQYEEKSETSTKESEGTSKPESNDSDNAITTTSSKFEGTVTFLIRVKGVLTLVFGILKRLKDLNVSLPQPIKRVLDAVQNLSYLQYFSSKPPPSEKTETPVVVTIPSVHELVSVGIRFQPSKGGIMGIEFDQKTGIFYLPVLRLDVNSEVIMRNLVAYEALTKPDFLVFTRYTELMRGIIDTVEDVKLLKDAKIIEASSSLSVEETEILFNGMSKSIGPTKTEKLDETIKKVNKYFYDNQKANPYSMFTNYVYSSWRIFTLLATLVFLAMTALQTFCSAYDCRHR